jgi:hypothetical protein
LRNAHEYVADDFLHFRLDLLDRLLPPLTLGAEEFQELASIGEAPFAFQLVVFQSLDVLEGAGVVLL